MPKALRYRLRSSRHTKTVAGWWRNIVFHWYTWEKDGLIFFSLLGLTFTALGLFIYYSLAEQDRNRDLTCLALNIYHEARGEPMAGKYAVAEVTMNRVAAKAYPNTVCEVVYQKNWDVIRRRYVAAFSWTEIDPVRQLRPKVWQDAWTAAEAVYYGRHAPQLKGALFYHAKTIRPSWARGKKPVAQIGRHIFYR
jgi:N-acetylmuramoyl-L-alanine amidase